jgi:glycosyltransferase 2 family protein
VKSSTATILQPPPTDRLKKTGKLILKIAISAVCLWYISGKLDYSKTVEAVKTANPWMLLASILCFCFSKALSSFRLNIYFRNIDVHLSELTNLKLYWLGMFYNLFLPGSISGDAYKVIRISSLYGINYKKATAAVLLDRISGLIALVIIAAFFWVIVFKFTALSIIVLAGGILTLPISWFIVKKFFPYFLPGYWPTFGWGMAVQLFQVLSMYCIMAGLHIQTQEIHYLLLFLISSVVAVLPFTIGGLGAREMVFFWGASFFLLDKQIAVSVSLLFYATSVISSALGLPFIFLDPLKQKNSKEL